MNLQELPDMVDALNKVYEGKKKYDKKTKRWWDDDGDGKGYEKGEVDGNFKTKKEHHEKDAEGNVVEHDIETEEETSDA